MNILVRYEDGYMNAKAELNHILRSLGDSKANIEILCPGMLGIETEIDGRKFAQELQDIAATNPETLKHVKAASPVDDWCATAELLATIKQEIKPRIDESLYRVDITVHQGEADADTLKQEIYEACKGRVEEDHPERIIKVDIFDKQASAAFCRQQYLFFR